MWYVTLTVEEKNGEGKNHSETIYMPFELNHFFR